jgi:dTDP-4-dehydrorhamnose reductase
MSASRKVLILGSSGMLGWVVDAHLSRLSRELNITSASRSGGRGATPMTFDAEAFLTGAVNLPEGFDFVINCIGIIKPYCKDNDPEGVRRAIRINALFPHVLASACRASGARLIQIATDCVYSGDKGNYVEADAHDARDVYGKTKSLGEVFDGSALNIRCSIIGPELKSHLSLLDWFLAQPDGSELAGFSHHRWNGVTTLQFAELCEQIIVGGPRTFDALVKTSTVHHFVPNEALTKFDLMGMFCRVFGRVHPVRNVSDVGPPVDRTLATRYSALAALCGDYGLEKALVDLRTFSEARPRVGGGLSA